MHLIGDIHQPLHNINDNGAGGNSKIVSFFGLKGFKGGPPNLHEVWDDGIIEHYGKSAPQLIAELGGHEDTESLAITSPITWVTECHKLGQDAYARLPEPNSDEVYILDGNTTYYDHSLPVVKQQLMKAGLRLGKALQSALG